MDTSIVPTPGPAILLPCPWCEEPIAVDTTTDALDCPGCLVHVDLDPPRSFRRMTSPEHPRATRHSRAA
jgi:hypothetical protein